MKQFCCKTLVSLMLAFFCCIPQAVAQVSADPGDEFYEYAQSWKSRGLVTDVPPLRPYPLANIKAILQEVIENGTTRDQERALDIYSRVMGKPYHVSMEGDFYVKHTMEETDGGEKSSSDTDKMIALYPSVKGDFGFKDDFVSIGYSAGFAISNATDTDFMPMYSNSLHDSIYDAASVGPADMFLDVNEAVALGRRNLFVQGGVYRSGYSAFLNEGLALNDSGYHSGNFSFTYLNGRFSYAQQISMIGATSSYDGLESNLVPDKMMAFHSVGYDLFDFLSVSFYESSVYGRRFDFSYLLPVPYMVAQGIGGASDNLAMGLLIDIKPAPGVLWETDIMCDDFPAEDFFKLNFDSKYRIAARTGFVYTPADSFLERLNVNYTMILPYTYSHWQYDSDSSASITASTVNYQNCTNSGVLIGSPYGPNSDAIKFSVDFRPLSRLRLSIDTTYIRHANICESLSDEEAMTYLCAPKGVYATDGSVNTHSMFANSKSSSGRHVESAWDSMNWLNQEHVQYTLQTGLNVQYDFKPSKKGRRVSLKGGVCFEYVRNYGVAGEMFPGGSMEKVEYNDDGEVKSFEYDGKTYSVSDPDYEDSISKIADDFRRQWAEQLTDRLNMYFTFGVSISF